MVSFMFLLDLALLLYLISYNSVLDCCPPAVRVPSCFQTTVRPISPQGFCICPCLWLEPSSLKFLPDSFCPSSLFKWGYSFCFGLVFFGLLACGILVPWPGIEPVLPAVEGQSLNHWTARQVPLSEAIPNTRFKITDLLPHSQLPPLLAFSP